MAFAYLTTEVRPDAPARSRGCRRPDRPGFGVRLDLASDGTRAGRVLLRSCPPVRGGPAPRDRHRRRGGESGRRACRGNGLVRGQRPGRRQDRDDPDRERLRRHARTPRFVRCAARSRSERGRTGGNRRPERRARAGRALRLSRDPESRRRAGVPRPASLLAGVDSWHGRATCRRWGRRASPARSCARSGTVGRVRATRIGRRSCSACRAASASPTEDPRAWSFRPFAGGYRSAGAISSRAQAARHSRSAGRGARIRAGAFPSGPSARLVGACPDSRAGPDPWPSAALGGRAGPCHDSNCVERRCGRGLTVRHARRDARARAPVRRRRRATAARRPAPRTGHAEGRSYH